MDFNGIFPTPVGVKKIEREFSDDELSFILGQERGKNSGNEISVASDVLDDPRLSALKEEVAQAVSVFLKETYNPERDPKIFLTQSWVNYTKPGQFHHQHNHPNSFLSGVVYVKTNNDKILFCRDRYEQVKLKPQEFNWYNSDTWWFDVNAGDIMIFPSYLTHRVPEVEEDGHERVSIAFNTFVQSVGDKEEMTALHLEVS